MQCFGSVVLGMDGKCRNKECERCYPSEGQEVQEVKRLAITIPEPVARMWLPRLEQGIALTSSDNRSLAIMMRAALANQVQEGEKSDENTEAT